MAALPATGAQPPMPGMDMSGMSMPAASPTMGPPAAPASTPAGFAAAPSASIVGGGAVAGSLDGALTIQMLPVLQQLVGVLQSLVGILQAQQGTLQLGGPVQQSCGGGPTIPPAAPAASPSASPISTPSAAPASNPLSNTLFPDPTAGAQPPISGGGAAAAPVAPTISVSGAQARAYVDSKFVTGPAPAAGSLVDALLNHGSTNVMAAKTELGVWKWVMDANGAGVYAHVHGSLAQLDNAALLRAIQAGQGMVHIHANDGSVHIHDM